MAPPITGVAAPAFLETDRIRHREQRRTNDMLIGRKCTGELWTKSDRAHVASAGALARFRCGAANLVKDRCRVR